MKNQSNYEQKNVAQKIEICQKNSDNKQYMLNKQNPVTMQLVIAEKPSVAMAIAAVIGASERKDGYMEGGGYLVSWCVGHLAGLADATHYGDYKKWRYEDLPILPRTWETVISPDKEEQFETLKNLMHRADVEALVCATDVG